MGKHSMNIWLIHTFFIYYIFKDYFFQISHNAIISYFMLVAFSTIVSILLNKFWCCVSDTYSKIRALMN